MFISTQSYFLIHDNSKALLGKQILHRICYRTKPFNEAMQLPLRQRAGREPAGNPRGLPAYTKALSGRPPGSQGLGAGGSRGVWLRARAQRRRRHSPGRFVTPPAQRGPRGGPAAPAPPVTLRVTHGPRAGARTEGERGPARRLCQRRAPRLAAPALRHTTRSRHARSTPFPPLCPRPSREGATHLPQTEVTVTSPARPLGSRSRSRVQPLPRGAAEDAREDSPRPRGRR